MDFKKAFKGIADYFTLAPALAREEYDYSVQTAPLTKSTLGQVFLSCFDIHYPCHKAVNTGLDILRLASIEGVTKGSFDASTLVEGFGFSYTEGKFEVEARASGAVLLKCDADFAEKVKALPSVAGVMKIERAPAAPKPPAP